MRYIKDVLVLRLNSPISDGTRTRLNDDFGAYCGGLSRKDPTHLSGDGLRIVAWTSRIGSGGCRVIV